MNYLIDTHIFLWALLSPEKLSNEASSKLKDSDMRIFISSITYWEIALKYSLGKLELEGVSPDELPGHAVEMSFDALDFTVEDAASFFRLPRSTHKDPFDRMIIWQAIRNHMTLISKDRVCSQYQQFGLRFIS